MTLLLLLTSSESLKPIEAAASASTTLTAELRSQTVRPVAECNVFFNSSAELRKSIEVAAAVFVSSASIAAELRNGTELAASIVQTSASLSASLTNGTELAASLVALSSVVTAGLTSGSRLSSATINAVSNVAVNFPPGRGYGSPVTAGSSRSGAGGTPTPGTGR